MAIVGDVAGCGGHETLLLSQNLRSLEGKRVQKVRDACLNATKREAGDYRRVRGLGRKTTKCWRLSVAVMSCEIYGRLDAGTHTTSVVTCRGNQEIANIF